MNSKQAGLICTLLLTSLLPLIGHAQSTIVESFTGTSTNNNWYIYGPIHAGSSTTSGTGLGGGGACLTASTTVNNTVGGSTGRVPGCYGNNYYSTTTLVGGHTTTSNLANAADPVGNGALRLTNGAKGNNDYGQNEAGAIVLATPYSTSNGLSINFTTATYGGNGGNGTGADGMSFFMADASIPFTLGSFGGSLGYACSKNANNRPYFGVSKGFIGIGIDEFGNYQIAGAQTGVKQYNSSNNPIYTAFTPNSITVRGAGDVTNASLLAAGLSQGQISASNYAAVANTCANGYLSDANNNAISSGGFITNVTAHRVPMAGYPILQTAVVVKPNTSILNPISNQQNSNTPARTLATPITYDINITSPATTSSGSTIPPILNFSYSYNGGIAQKVVVNQPLGNMPSTLNMGFAASTGSFDNIHEITCFTVSPTTLSASSAAGNVIQNAKVKAGIQIFIGAYNPTNWSGSLQAVPLNQDGTTGVITVSNTPAWDASCVLTGGLCQSTGASTTAQAPSNRTILTTNGLGTANVGGGPGSASPSGAGMPFQWANFTSSQKSTLDYGNATTSSQRLNYYRGDRTLERYPVGSITNSAAIYRARSSVLADIINSSSTWVGPPLAPYSTFTDALTGTAGAESSYLAYATGPAATRMNVVYVGANDGMLHGFRAGVYSAGAPVLTTANNDGMEVLAYVPGLAFDTLSAPSTLDYSSPYYSHNAYVDATPGMGDLFYNGAWHTWIVGGLGAGGNETGEVGDATSAATSAIPNPLSAAGGIFALDVTTPGTPSTQTETAAAANVVGDWKTIPSFTPTSGTPGTGVTNLTCTFSTSASPCGLHLGSTYGAPIIRRLHNGNWAAIFGNGLDSPLGTAGIYIMNVNISDGAISFYYLDTGRGRTTASRVSSVSGTSVTTTGITVNNGIANVASADFDGDHIVDYVYAGDVLGNLWRFDLTSSNPTNWAVSSTTPLFSVPSTGGFLRPISTSVIVTQATVGTVPYVLVDFATGRKFPQNASGAESYASGTQGIYGIWDWNMSSWNSKPANAGKQLASRTSAPTANLVTQTLTATTATVNGVANTNVYQEASVPVCWLDSTACGGSTASNQHTGWYVPFPTATEQAIYNPTVLNHAFLINTTVPAVTNTLSCASTAAKGYTIAVSLVSGGNTSLFNTPTGTNPGDYNALSPYVGLGLGGVGTNFIITSFNGLQTIVSTLLTGGATATNLGMAPPPGSPSRITWMELR